MAIVENLKSLLLRTNLAVRKMLVNRGIVPENLPADEDIKKVQRKLEQEDKKLLKDKKSKK